MNEIQHFVNVALATAAGGEGDLSHDKLSDLRIVGSGFASLIYNFPKKAGFNELKKACTYVWDALDKKPNLPQLLVSQYKISAYIPGSNYQDHTYRLCNIVATVFSCMYTIRLYACRRIVIKILSGISRQKKPRGQWRSRLMARCEISSSMAATKLE